VRVLLVEDETRIASFIRKGLQEEQYVVDVAGDGDAALDFAASAEYDLIILDIMLPRYNGFQVCGELRQRGTQ
jgi:two-component system copper resistance phosphate regulon response regulator CusR